MDINLPGMEGIEALQPLRAGDETEDIRVLALTAAAIPCKVEKWKERRLRGVSYKAHRRTPCAGDHLGLPQLLTFTARQIVLNIPGVPPIVVASPSRPSGCG